MNENGLHDHIGYWLRRLSDEVHGRFERQLAAHDVTVAQWNVLVTVYHGQATNTSEVARFIAIDPGAVSRLVDRLIDKNLITRSPDPASRRRSQLKLTSTGQSLVPVLIAAADENDEVFFSTLTVKKQTELIRQLRALMPTERTQPQGAQL